MQCLSCSGATAPRHRDRAVSGLTGESRPNEDRRARHMLRPDIGIWRDRVAAPPSHPPRPRPLDRCPAALASVLAGALTTGPGLPMLWPCTSHGAYGPCPEGPVMRVRRSPNRPMVALAIAVLSLLSVGGTASASGDPPVVAALRDGPTQHAHGCPNPTLGRACGSPDREAVPMLKKIIRNSGGAGKSLSLMTCSWSTK